ncbi:TIGR01459 family HAD-type hydrolase [Bauldia litoralis]|uniref:HAD-superfamily class IIA hydrolase, TIGR01459 n=1 Tax=Bauldia litoralis TaxID=665467 RepID=A0A1G6C594_9HYPH|nr:TIGR01459 family HAD-type hydrolase [Bauldia litoralis]SDB27948.1 HAD-superfamily class IIA hydrolase, TIGR01459 [Bauldia litoralis]
MSNSIHPPRIGGLSDIAADYQFVLCDAWGVIHNGVKAYTAAVDALRAFRESGKTVLIITNAPRPKASVLKQFTGFGVDHAAFDDVVTSGGAARDFLAARPGIRVFHLGAERDHGVYEGLDVVQSTEDEAEIISCTGLFDDKTETPDDYADAFLRWRDLGLPLLCANPDKVVERGHEMVWCAGAMAERYASVGGETIILGKPHRPIYETAMARFAELAGGPVDKGSILAIGDAVETDLRGANDFGLDVLFVTAGIHADVFGAREEPDGDKVAAFLAEAGIGARAFIPHLTW